MSFTHGALSGSGTTGISEMFRIDQVISPTAFTTFASRTIIFSKSRMGRRVWKQVAPLRTFTTSNSFEIALSASGQQISAIADQNIPPNEVQHR